mmetsp:Transcript_19768/g.55741  ORF Transcript_19768/g.55741 Transcript_19768/m.55741 type:complete len:202 (-) Transcript_19768:565-1170(-)
MHRCGAHVHDAVSALSFLDLPQSSAQVNRNCSAVLLALSCQLARMAAQDALHRVCGQSMSCKPDAPRRDVDVAQVEADVARGIAAAMLQHYLLADIEELDVSDCATFFIIGDGLVSLLVQPHALEEVGTSLRWVDVFVIVVSQLHPVVGLQHLRVIAYALHEDGGDARDLPARICDGPATLLGGVCGIEDGHRNVILASKP